MDELFIKPSVSLGEERIRLSALDQQNKRLYVNVLLIFGLDQRAAVGDIVSHLQKSLGIALSGTPDFTSTVRPLPGSKRKELELSLGPESGVPLRIVYHDGSTINPTDQRNTPEDGSHVDLTTINFSDVETSEKFLFVPSASCEDPCPEGLPALLIQINLIEGGLVLGLAWHHAVSDAWGIYILLNSWALHTKTLLMNGIPGTTEAPKEQVGERWRLEYGSQDANLAQFPAYVIDPARRSPLSSSSPHLLDRPSSEVINPIVSTWYFSAEKLQSLRCMLGEAEVENSTQFTHSEAVTALVWKHLSQARLLHHQAPEGTSLLSSPINYRSRVKPLFHDNFLGNMASPSYGVRVPLGEVCEESTPRSLAKLAAIVRNTIVAYDENSMRAFIGLLETLPSVTDLALGCDAFPGPDLRVTDLSGVDRSGQSWGEPLGDPICARTGFLERGIAYFLPKDCMGGFEVQLQCERESLERLERDEVFTRFAQLRC